MKTLHDWIFDVDALGHDMVVQMVDTEEHVHRLHDRFAAAVGEVNHGNAGRQSGSAWNSCGK